MRATIRITWLLLSLSFLLHNISSDDPDPASSSVSKAATTAGPTPAVASTGVSVSGNDITALTTKKQQPTQAPTTVKPTSAAPVSPVVMTTQPKPTDKPATNPPQAPTVTNKPAPAPTTISAVVKDTTVPAATPTPPKPTTLAATADSSGASRVVPNPPTTPKPENPVTTMTAVAGAPIVPTGNAANVRTTQNPKVSTVASTQREKPTTHITDPSTMSQVDSKVEQGGTEKTVVTAKSPEQTTSKALGPIVNTGTTSSIPTTPIKRGPPPAPKEATTSLQTTTTTTITTITTASLPTTFLYSLNSKHEKDEEKGLVEMCKRLMVNFQDGDCVLKLQRHNGEVKFDTVDIKGKVSPILAAQYYEEITKKPTDNKTLIAILASCGALLIMIVILAVCASHRRKPYNENQQHLTEELHTVENGYHDNPTLEVMEVQPEMQEKKVALNGEFNDSWIVPMDNLPKVCEEIPEEEDTHL